MVSAGQTGTESPSSSLSPKQFLGGSRGISQHVMGQEEHGPSVASHPVSACLPFLFYPTGWTKLTGGLPGANTVAQGPNTRGLKLAALIGLASREASTCLDVNACL